MNNEKDDILILNLIRKGEKKAFNKLFDTFFIPLCRYLYVYIEDKQIIEELVLDVFAYIWEHRSVLQIKISLKAYLFQSVRNRYFNYVRDNRHMVSLDDVMFELKEETDNHLEYEELEQIIREAVFSLPDKCKEVYSLSREKNQTNQEISDQLDISVKTVEGHITKALRHIKKHLGEKYYYLW